MASEQEKDTERQPEKNTEAKRAYRRPQILSREPLEAMAAVCSPSPPAKTASLPACSNGPINS